MIMGKQETLASVLNDARHNIHERKRSAGRIAVETVQVKAGLPLVDVSNPESFSIGVAPAETILKKPARRADVVERQMMTLNCSPHTASTAVNWFGSETICSEMEIRLGAKQSSGVDWIAAALRAMR
jgi:hypothetical protein